MNACFPLKRILFVIIVTLTFGFKCSAAELPHISRSDRLNGWKTLRDFEELFKDRKASVVEILENGNQIGLGTVVSDDGYIVTKASEFGESLEVRLFDYSKHVPAVVSVDIKNDFALLKIDVKDLNPVEWSDPSIAKMGEWVMSPHEDETQVRIGVISATSRPVYEQPGALGVKLVDGNEFLMEDDLLDVLGLVNKINSGVRPIDKWLKNELSDTLKSIMKEDLTENSNKASFRDALLPDLNSLIFERSFYQEDRFNGIDLNPETTKVISSERRSIRRSVLNRMLLVDAYGSELASGKKGAIIFEVIKDSAADKAGLNAG
ncbi:MAG: hypothetical protein HOH33_14440, partial [Verrucomicrobia bacterium]|nr:hypothetical protein [Verrucomicrobiota bacterium]